jgi:allantoate deiminase
VRNAGRYDGMLGVLTAIEVVDSLHRQGRRLKKAIEIVGFCDEEGRVSVLRCSAAAG